MTRRGFTLVELLVGIALVAVASGAIWAFYSIGISTERRSRERSESTAALRLVYKLLDERIRRRETGVPSIYLKAGGFAGLANLTGEILARPLDGGNPGLERALGLGDLAGDGVDGGTVGAFLATVPGGRLEIAGPFVLTATVETGALSPAVPVDFELAFDGGRPDRLAVGGLLPGAGSVEARPAWAAATVETNDGTLHDLSPAAGDPAGSTVAFRVVRSSGSAPPGRFAVVYASSARAARPSARVVPADAPVGRSLYHVRGSALLSDDGLLFHEPGDEGPTAHALYLRRPPAGEAELDADGNPLLELRYAMSIARSGVREVYDDPLVTNVRRMAFRYYDADALELPPGAAWAWLPGDRAATVAFEIELDRGEPARADLPGWRP